MKFTLKLNLKGKFKVRGFKLKPTAEKRFVGLLLNSGAGVYNAQRWGVWRR
ncbi:MAG: hypothetical protein PHH10_01325 [Dysgonamonadaceae bacterium]|nr:hypothetical protein [Dysgonamonadaceae bacterium]